MVADKHHLGSIQQFYIPPQDDNVGMLDIFIFYVFCSSACQLQLMFFIIMAAKTILTIGMVDENKVINTNTSLFPVLICAIKYSWAKENKKIQQSMQLLEQLQEFSFPLESTIHSSDTHFAFTCYITTVLCISGEENSN